MLKLLSFKFQESLGPFTFLFWKGPLKQDFLDIDLTSLFEVRNVGNTSAMRVIFFLRMLKI